MKTFFRIMDNWKIQRPGAALRLQFWSLPGECHFEPESAPRPFRRAEAAAQAGSAALVAAMIT